MVPPGHAGHAAETFISPTHALLLLPMPLPCPVKPLAGNGLPAASGRVLLVENEIRKVLTDEGGGFQRFSCPVGLARMWHVC